MTKITHKTIQLLLLTICWLGLASLSTSVQAQEVAIVNAASYAKDGGTGATAGSGIVTPEGLASAFGTFNITAGQTSYTATPGQALPKVLGGVRVRVGTTDADLLFVGTTQINLIIPTGTATGGIVDVVVTNANNTTVPGKVRVEAFAPGLFSAKTDGKGVAAADWTITGQFPYPKVYTISGGQPVHVDLDAGTKQRPTFLVLYASGVRGAPDTVANDPIPSLKNVAESCNVTIQGVPARVDYAGRQPDFFGLDQLNVVIPPELSGLGILNVRVEIKSGQTSRISNDVEIKVGGQLTQLTILKDLNLAGDTVTGALTAEDALEMDTNPNSPFYRKTYFIDVYRFRTTAANTTIAIDLRGNLADPDPLDTQIIVRKVETNGTQTFFAADDQGGGFGNCPNPPGNCKPIEANNNSLLLTVVPDPGEYWIFVTSADVAPNDMGAYTLKFSTGVLTPLTYGQTVNGSFSGTTKVQTAAGVYVDAYYFVGREGETIRATMRAPAPVDSFLILRERNGDEIRLDDNSGGGNDAQISITLPVNNALSVTRPFILVATPLANLVTGSYTLQLEKTAGLLATESEAIAPEFRTPSRVSPESDPRRAVSSRAMWRRAIPKEQ
ncbi:MAG TPA: hypothetical protein VFZ34_31440 [Blastocatellia bacterium]|nr:hypothetical protein [Blastocatellia bacterium]